MVVYLAIVGIIFSNIYSQPIEIIIFKVLAQF
jgi:hypothetical protein